MHADAAAAQADGIEADQAGVAGQAQHHSERDLRATELAERMADGAVAVLIELVARPVQRQRRDQQRDDDGEDPLPCRGGGAVAGRWFRSSAQGCVRRARAVSTQPWRIVRLSLSFDQRRCRSR
jgi:hypothetical protein